jgi:hypothetical protein
VAQRAAIDLQWFHARQYTPEDSPCVV